MYTKKADIASISHKEGNKLILQKILNVDKNTSEKPLKNMFCSLLSMMIILTQILCNKYTGYT